MRAAIVSLICAVAAPAWAQSYRLPLELAGGGPAPYVTAYRDLSGSGGGLRDWSCGTNTYDGHRGTDIGIGGFAAMDAGSRWVVAAADGTVTVAIDGCFDRCTSGRCDCGGGFGNSVRVTHADGKSTWYGHLMNGSVAVRQGQVVRCGERLGRVGSSGWSTGPHLHFEPRYGDNTSDDPFAGPCGGPASFWVEQGAYEDLPAERCEGGAPPPPPPPAKGMLKGVVFDRGATAGPSDPGNVRVPGATLTLSDGTRVTARDGDAYFELELDVGAYTLEASAPGFEAATRAVEVRGGEDVWGSIGVAKVVEPSPPPAGTPVGDGEAEAVEAEAPATGAEVVPGAGAGPGAVGPRVDGEIAGAGCRCVGGAGGGGAAAAWGVALVAVVAWGWRRRGAATGSRTRAVFGGDRVRYPERS